ncbi:MAG: hypothetical protein MMC33_004729 [Icmadophila ericetorum]|nr:hypothetical protein [Icmadophila ericetorum]
MISASHHKWSKKRELKKWSPPWGEEATKQEPHKLPLEAKRQHIPRWTGPFPFLALPLELRRMIYDCYFADLRVFVPAAIRPSQLPRPRSYVPDERDVTMLLGSFAAFMDNRWPFTLRIEIHPPHVDRATDLSWFWSALREVHQILRLRDKCLKELTIVFIEHKWGPPCDKYGRWLKGTPKLNPRHECKVAHILNELALFPHTDCHICICHRLLEEAELRNIAEATEQSRTAVKSLPVEEKQRWLKRTDDSIDARKYEFTVRTGLMSLATLDQEIEEGYGFAGSGMIWPSLDVFPSHDQRWSWRFLD